MADIGKYKKDRRDALILLCIEGLIYYGIAILIMKSGDVSAGLAMVMMPLILICYVKYTTLSTKIEILEELENKGEDAVGVSAWSDKKLRMLRLAGVIAIGLAAIVTVWLLTHRLTTTLNNVGF
jgi:hypothetical protein